MAECRLHPKLIAKFTIREYLSAKEWRDEERARRTTKGYNRKALKEAEDTYNRAQARLDLMLGDLATMLDEDLKQ